MRSVSGVGSWSTGKTAVSPDATPEGTMGLLLKPRITEREAAEIFLKLLFGNVERAWPRIFEIVRPSFPDAVALIDNEQAAKGEFFLAAVAIHLEGLAQVLESSRAARLVAFIAERVGAPPFCRSGDAAARERLDRTLGVYREACRAVEGGVPYEAVAGHLRDRLGATLSARPAAPAAEPLPDPLARVLGNFGVSWWRSFARKYWIRRSSPA